MACVTQSIVLNAARNSLSPTGNSLTPSRVRNLTTSDGTFSAESGTFSAESGWLASCRQKKKSPSRSRCASGVTSHRWRRTESW